MYQIETSTVMSKSYFKTNNHLFFFDDENALSAATAFTDAVLASENNVISVWRRPRVSGPWEQCELIGHRSESSIFEDIEVAEAALASPDMSPKFVETWQLTLNKLHAELELRRGVD